MSTKEQVKNYLKNWLAQSAKEREEKESQKSKLEDIEMRDESNKASIARDSWDYEPDQEQKIATENVLEPQQLPDNQQEEVSHPNWIPPHLRRPEDEFFDLSTVQPLRIEQVSDGLEILTIVEGKGSLPDPGDTVYYKH